SASRARHGESRLIKWSLDFVNPGPSTHQFSDLRYEADHMSDIRPQRRDQTTSRQHRFGRPASRPPTAAREPHSAGSWLYGTHAVAAALANPERRWHRLAVLTGREEEARRLVAEARAIRLGKDEAVRVLDHNDFAVILPVSAVHQGIALEVEP